MARRLRQSIREIAAPAGLVGGPFGSNLVANDYCDQGIPVIRGSNLGQGRYVSGDFAFVSQEKFERDLARNTATAGDIVFTQRGTLGQIALIAPSDLRTYVISQSQMRLRVDPKKANADFVYYAASTPEFQRLIRERAIATGVPHINLGILGELTLPLPSVLTQQAIADVLGALDDKIASNALTTDSASALAAAEFQGAVRASSRVVRVADVSTLITRGSAPRYVSEDKGLPILNQKCIRNGRVNRMMARSGDPSRIRKDTVLTRGDVLINSTGTGTLGRVGRWTEDLPASLDSHVTLVRPAPHEGVNHVGYALLALEGVFESLAEGSTGQTELSRASVAQTEIRMPSIVKPSLEELLDSLTRFADAATAQASMLTTLRDQLLPKLMSGELRVEDAEKQVEEVV